MKNNSLKNNILRDIDTIARETHTIYETNFRNYKLQRGQFLFLSRICENPGISMISLVHNLKMDKTTVTKATQKLIKAEYVRKEEDENDKRLSHIFPTPKALDIYEQIINEKNRIIDICLKNIDSDQVKIMEKIVKEILQNIDIEWQKIIKAKNSYNGSS